MHKQTISKQPRLLTCQQNQVFELQAAYSLDLNTNSSGSCSSMHDNKDKLTLQINQQSTTVAILQLISRWKGTQGRKCFANCELIDYIRFYSKSWIDAVQRLLHRKSNMGRFAWTNLNESNRWFPSTSSSSSEAHHGRWCSPKPLDAIVSGK